jgi:hypothetical protein
LPAGFSAGGVVNLSSVSATPDRTVRRAFSSSLSHSIGGPWAAFAEVFTSTSTAPGAVRADTVDGGFTVAIGPDVKLDVEAGRALNSAAVDWSAGAGITVRMRGQR